MTMNEEESKTKNILSEKYAKLKSNGSIENLEEIVNRITNYILSNFGNKENTEEKIDED